MVPKRCTPKGVRDYREIILGAILKKAYLRGLNDFLDEGPRTDHQGPKVAMLIRRGSEPWPWFEIAGHRKKWAQYLPYAPVRSQRGADERSELCDLMMEAPIRQADGRRSYEDHPAESNQGLLCLW